MEFNRTSGKTIHLKESIDYYKEHYLDISLGHWENTIKKEDFITTKKISFKDIENLEKTLNEFLRMPKNAHLRGQLIAHLCRILDPTKHSLLYSTDNNKPQALKITWGSLFLKYEFPLKLLAIAVIGFFCKELQLSNKEQK